MPLAKCSPVSLPVFNQLKIVLWSTPSFAAAPSTEFPFQQRDLLLLSIDQFLLQADRFLVQAGLLSQQPILVSQVDQFFFCCHALTLHAFVGFGKSLEDLSSYHFL